MLLGQYIKRNMPDAVELNDMVSHPGEGYAISQMEAAPVDTGSLRMHIKAYANGPDGPYLQGRLALYHQVHELFALLAAEPSNKGMKGYELKDSFIGGEEADLIMLTVSHEERSQEDIAYNVLLCSKNAVGERRARIRDGVRIGGMCVAEEFGYRGEFRSSVHPLALPLNLSEVYVLMDALAAYERGCSRFDPHGRTARRIAGMIKRELSGYAKEKLGSRLEGMGFAQLEEVDPMFVPDIPGERCLVASLRGLPIGSYMKRLVAGRVCVLRMAGACKGLSCRELSLSASLRVVLKRRGTMRPKWIHDPSVSSGEAMMTTTLSTGLMSWM